MEAVVPGSRPFGTRTARFAGPIARSRGMKAFRGNAFDSDRGAVPRRGNQLTIQGQARSGDRAARFWRQRGVRSASRNRRGVRAQERSAGNRRRPRRLPRLRREGPQARDARRVLDRPRGAEQSVAAVLQSSATRSQVVARLGTAPGSWVGHSAPTPVRDRILEPQLDPIRSRRRKNLIDARHWNMSTRDPRLEPREED